VPWATARSPVGIAPETISVTVDFGQRALDLDTAQLIVVAQVNGQTLIRRLPITALCAASQSTLPLISR